MIAKYEAESINQVDMKEVIGSYINTEHANKHEGCI